MQHHNRHTVGIAWPDVDDVKPRAVDVDHAPLRRMRALQRQNAGLRDGGQHDERRHDND